MRIKISLHVPSHHIKTQQATEAKQRHDINQVKTSIYARYTHKKIIKRCSFTQHIPSMEPYQDTIQTAQDKSRNHSKNRFKPFILTCALTLSCNRDMGSLLCLITTRYGSFCTAPISSWNFWRDDCLITRVFAEMQSMFMQSLTRLVQVSHF